MFSDNFLKQFYSYKRPFQEVNGYSIKRLENGNDLIVMNALGVNPSDVKMEVDFEYSDVQVLRVEGKTENEELVSDFSVKFSFYVRKPIKNIYKTFRSGLVILEIEYDKPSKPTVKFLER